MHFAAANPPHDGIKFQDILVDSILAAKQWTVLQTVYYWDLEEKGDIEGSTAH